MLPALTFTSPDWLWLLCVLLGVAFVVACIFVAAGMGSKGVFVDDRQSKPILAPTSNGGLPPCELTVGEFLAVSSDLTPDHASALHFDTIDDETPLPPNERETRRRERMLILLRRTRS